ncbi:hypothetical protein VTJ49DRAFT_4405 [Mycothermus thermophilus]|uniref:Uncharacterized protein n=1 Tax=Humicola insolens TaxID=85995 RepID=A0ABR3V609_HUMIN
MTRPITTSLRLGGFILALLAVTRPLGVRAACYYASGRLAPNDVPCRDDTQHSVCCGQGYACLSNGICMATGAELQKPGASKYVRGACTDPTWRSSNCPLFCIEEGVDFLDGGNGIQKCEGRSDDTYYCVNANSATEASCVDGRKLLFFPGTPSVLTTIGVPQNTPTPTPSPKPSTTTTSSENRPASSSSSSNTPEPTKDEPSNNEEEEEEEPTETESPGAVATKSSSTTSPINRPNDPEETESPTGHASNPLETESSNNTSDPATASSSNSNTGAIVGGVLGGLALIVLAGLAGWILARRRDRPASAPPTHDPDNSDRTAMASTSMLATNDARTITTTTTSAYPPPFDAGSEYSHSHSPAYPVGAYEVMGESKPPGPQVMAGAGSVVYHELPPGPDMRAVMGHELETERRAELPAGFYKYRY